MARQPKQPDNKNSPSCQFQTSAGIDEAGRGCLAGPVVAAAVILPDSYYLPELDDSKLLSAAKRKKLEILIKNCSIWSLGLTWQRRIEEINILQASLEAMARAVAHLKTRPAQLLVDGKFIIPPGMLAAQTGRKNFLPTQTAIVGGDHTVPAISAASILAKTFRDRLMEKLSRRWPLYGFEKHKGYGTKQHLEVLKEYGPCPLHRCTFKGVLPGGQLCFPGL